MVALELLHHFTIRQNNFNLILFFLNSLKKRIEFIFGDCIILIHYKQGKCTCFAMQRLDIITFLSSGQQFYPEASIPDSVISFSNQIGR